MPAVSSGVLVKLRTALADGRHGSFGRLALGFSRRPLSRKKREFYVLEAQ
jgi:hypothetical protein